MYSRIHLQWDVVSGLLEATTNMVMQGLKLGKKGHFLSGDDVE